MINSNVDRHRIPLQIWITLYISLYRSNATRPSLPTQLFYSVFRLPESGNSWVAADTTLEKTVFKTNLFHLSLSIQLGADIIMVLDIKQLRDTTH